MVDCHDKLPSETPIRVRTLPPPKKTARPTSPPRLFLRVSLQEVVFQKYIVRTLSILL